MATLLGIIDKMQRLVSSKWYWDIRHCAADTEEANGFIACIEKGGRVKQANGNLQQNPAPYDVPINLSNSSQNILNFCYTDNGHKGAVSGIDVLSSTHKTLTRVEGLGRRWAVGPDLDVNTRSVDQDV